MALDRQSIIEKLGSDGRDLSGLDLTGADLSKLDLRGVNLSRSDLTSADLRWTTLEGADLHSAVLRRADARWANLRSANLRQADLDQAILHWADISDADLTGASLGAVDLSNVEIGATQLPAQPGSREWLTRLWTAQALWGLASPRVLLGGLLSALVLSYFWGWLYRASYFELFQLSHTDVLEPWAADYMLRGWGVLSLALRMVVALPLILAYGLLILGILLIVPLTFLNMGERVLREIDHPGARRGLVLALFALYFAAFFGLYPWLHQAFGWLLRHGLPVDDGFRLLRDTLAQASTGGRVLFLMVVSVALIPIAVLLRWLAYRTRTYEPAVDVRLRYPAVNNFIVAIGTNRLLAHVSEPGLWARNLAIALSWALFLVLGTFLTQVGRLHASAVACDGGDLPRVTLYSAGSAPGGTQAEDNSCLRLLVRSGASYLVFFPYKTDPVTLRPAVSIIPRERVAHVAYVSSGSVCSTCIEGPPEFQERIIYERGVAEIRGQVGQVTADTIMLDEYEGPTDAIQVQDTTAILTSVGQPADVDAIRPGAWIQAMGVLAEDSGVLAADEIRILPAQAIVTGTPASPAGEPSITVVPRGSSGFAVQGLGWDSVLSVDLGIARRGSTAFEYTLERDLPVMPDGSFTEIYDWEPDMPAGSGYVVLARDELGRVASAELPARTDVTSGTPTRFATPTLPRFATPFPTATGIVAPPSGLKGPSTAIPSDQCRDDFEPDNRRGLQKAIYVGETQSRTFYPAGDIDLAYFQVKGGRWYRVSTSDLARGVDTVLAVGDLDPGTPCEPPGCNNDDKAALTLESEIVFRATGDQVGIITVWNRGGRYACDATYQLTVEEFLPQPSATPTPGPPTATPTPGKDRFEPNDRCSIATGNFRVGTVYSGLYIWTRSDIDHYITEPLATGAYKVRLFDIPAGTDYDLIVRDSTSLCTELERSEQGRPATEESVVVDVCPGSVLAGYPLIVHVWAPDGSFSDTAAYSIEITRLGDPSECPTFTPTRTPTSTRTPTPTP
jgi:hypothetical protein